MSHDADGFCRHDEPGELLQVGVDGRNAVVIWCQTCGSLTTSAGGGVSTHRWEHGSPGSSAWRPPGDRSIGLVWLLRRWLIHQSQPESSTSLRGLVNLTRKALHLE